MKKKQVFSTTIILILFLGSPTWASPLLVDWAFNDNGTVLSDIDTDALPGHFNVSSFDWDTGLGDITLNYVTAGAYLFQAFFDHEIIEGTNTLMSMERSTPCLQMDKVGKSMNQAGFSAIFMTTCWMDS